MVWALLNGCPIPDDLKTVRIQLVFLMCVKHKQRGNMDHIAMPIKLSRHVVKLPDGVITYVASLM